MISPKKAECEFEKYRAFADISGNGVFVVNTETAQIVDVNLTASQLLQYSREELLNLKVQDIQVGAPIEMPGQWQIMVEAIKKSKGPLILTGVHRRKDGTTYPVEIRATYKLLNGTPYTLVIARDITHQKNIEFEFRRFHQILNQVGDALFVVDGKTLKFTHVNLAACQSLGYTQEELLNLSVADICHFDSNNEYRLEDLTKYCKKNGEPIIVHAHHRRKDNSVFPVEVVLSYHDFEGRDYLIASVRDTTETKTLIESSHAARKLAETANQAKTIFLSNMSHEIRTPLSAILGFINILVDDPAFSGRQLEFLKIIERNSNHLLALVDDLLDVSKVEADRLYLNIAPMSPADEIIAAISVFQPAAYEKRLRLNLKFSSELPETIHCDSQRFRQIIYNLLSNAVKFTQKGSIDVDVSCELSKKQNAGQINVIVRDSGIGMADEVQKNAFKPFSRGEEETNAQFEGTGLGLSISRSLARRLGGDVVILKSAVNKGSTFKISIDIGDISNMRLKSISELELPTNLSILDIAAKKKITGQLDGHRILIAEDSEDITELLKHYLLLAGAKVDSCLDGKAAIDLATRNSYCAILMDIEMPILSGHEATKKLRATGYCNPILALTAHAIPDERAKCIKSGCNEVLSKPIDSKQLINTLERYCNRTPSPLLHKTSAH